MINGEYNNPPTHSPDSAIHPGPSDICGAREGTCTSTHTPYRGTSLMRNSAPLGPCSRTMHMVIWWFQGVGLFLMSEVPLYNLHPTPHTLHLTANPSQEGSAVHLGASDSRRARSGTCTLRHTPCRGISLMRHTPYRGTSLIRKSPTPYNRHRALGIVLL